MDLPPACLEYYGARLGIVRAEEFCMIEYQPYMCIAEVQEIRNEPGRNWVTLYSQDDDTYRWNVSDRYLEYLREDPAVPLCPIPGW